MCANSRRLQNFCTHSSIQLVRKHAKCVGTPFWRLSAIFTLISKLVVYQAVLMHKYNRRTPCTLWYGGLIFIFYFILINDALLSPVSDWWTEPLVCYYLLHNFGYLDFFQNQMVQHSIFKKRNLLKPILLLLVLKKSNL